MTSIMSIAQQDQLDKIGRVTEIQQEILAYYPSAQDQSEASQIQDALASIKGCSSAVIKYTLKELNIELEARKCAHPKI